MINHARTLLVNVAGEETFAGYLGEEILPPDYRPVQLTSPLLAVRRILFGTAPDRTMLNYRSRQLLQLLHATELVEFLTDLDPRITYTFDDGLYDDSLFQPRVSRFAGSAAAQLFVSGQQGPPDATGQLQKIWDVTVTSGSLANVHLHFPLRQQSVAYTVSQDLSSSVPLLLSDLSVRFRPEVGASWRIAALTRPTAELGDLTAELRQAGEPVLLELFGQGTAAGASQPLLTFYNLWQDHRELAYQLGGLVLALIYQTEALR